MASAEHLTNETRFMALFLGSSGSGKTVAECSFPGPIKLFDFDGRIRGILGAPWITPEMRKQIDYTYYPPKTGKGDEPNYVRLNKELEALQVMGPRISYKTIILDSLTSAAFALLQDAIPLTHAQGGKKIGVLNMTGPEDYGFEAQGIYNIVSFFRSLQVQNVIISAHLVDRYGKPKKTDGTPDTYAESVVVGKKLSIRDKIGTNVLIYFDHIIEFDRYESGGKMKYEATFQSDIARTSMGVPTTMDITGRNFYNLIQPYMRGKTDEPADIK